MSDLATTTIRTMAEKFTVDITSIDVVVIEPIGWLIERQKSHRGKWRPSVFLPLSLAHSTLEFFCSERERVLHADSGSEGMRLVMMVNKQRVEIAVVVRGKIDRLINEPGKDSC